MIRGIYGKIFLWFCFAMTVTSAAVLWITILFHGQSLGPRWMRGVLDEYARSAVDVYEFSGEARLGEFLEKMETSTRMRATLLDPEGRDISGRGIPPAARDVLDQAKDTGESTFKTGIRWRGASVVDRPQGSFILVAEVKPYAGLWSLANARIPILRLVVALISGGLMCLLLARHLAEPIRTLQAVAGRIADGDLSVRASPAIGSRKDELSDLACDFDRMADRIQSLLEKQQALLADVSHELRSPLTRISLSLELLRRGDNDALARMEDDIDRLDNLVGEILAVARLQGRGDQQALGVVNLRPILESVVEDARFEGRRDSKAIVLSHVEDSWLNADPALLRSCVENVVRNAVHYTKPHTDVVVSLERVETEGEGRARILIMDQGEGVPEDALRRLFDPFYRVAHTADEHHGTGLGLSITQRIVSAQGGTIIARNRTTGGLEIEIQLPVIGHGLLRS